MPPGTPPTELGCFCLYSLRGFSVRVCVCMCVQSFNIALPELPKVISVKLGKWGWERRNWIMGHEHFNFPKMV